MTWFFDLYPPVPCVLENLFLALALEGFYAFYLLRGIEGEEDCLYDGERERKLYFHKMWRSDSKFCLRYTKNIYWKK